MKSSFSITLHLFFSLNSIISCLNSYKNFLTGETNFTWLLETCCHCIIFVGVSQTQRKKPGMKALHSVDFPCLQLNSHLAPWQIFCLTKTINRLTLQSSLGYFLLCSPPSYTLVCIYKACSKVFTVKPGPEKLLSSHITQWQVFSIIASALGTLQMFALSSHLLWFWALH